MLSNFKFGYREVIPDQSISEKWKEIVLSTGGTQSILQDVKVAERAGGYCYKNAFNYYTRNRFIYWRIYHDVLELVEQSLDLNLSDARIRYRFTDTPILDGITIYEIDLKVIILVPTVCSVHVLTFPHPDRFHKQTDLFGCHPDLTVPSIFTDTTVVQVQDPSTYHVINNIGSKLPHAATSILNVQENDDSMEAIFLLSYINSNALLIRMILNTTQCFISELKQDSIVPRFLSGLAGAFRSGKSNDNQLAVSLLLYNLQNECVALILTRDGHLQIWSCNKGHLIGSKDTTQYEIEQNAPLTQGSQNHIMRKSIESDEDNLIIGIYLCFMNICKFQIFKIGYDDGKFQIDKLCSMYTPERDLVDFQLDNKSLWSVWRDVQGDCTVTNLYFDNSDDCVWSPAVLEPLPPRDYLPTDTSLDPRQAYSDYIFHPGRFPFFVIIRALSIYRKSALLQDVSISPNLLKQRVCMAVEAEIQAEVLEYELSDDDYLEIANRCWSRFYSCCTQYNATAARPLGIVQLPTSAGLVLVRKGTISVLRPMDMLEHIVLNSTSTTVDQLIASQLVPNDGILCQDLLQLISILVSIEQCLGDEVKSNIERELRCLHSPDQILTDLIDELINDNTDCSISSTVIWQLCKKASTITHLYTTILFLLDLLRLDKTYMIDDDEQQLQHDSEYKDEMVDYLYSSALGVSITTETVNHMAIVRFSICRNLLFLQTILLQGQQQDELVLESIRSNCMPDTVIFTQAYFTIVWLNETLSTPVALLDSYHQRLASLQLPAIVTSARLTNQQRPSTVTELFIVGSGGQQAHQLLQHHLDDVQSLPLWHHSLLLYAGLITKLIWPIGGGGGSMVLGDWLLASGQHLILQQYIRQLSTWCDWNQFGRQFQLALTYLTNGERKKALDLFYLAANGVCTEQCFNNLLQLDTNKPENSIKIEYYLKVIGLFEQYEALDCAINVARTAISRADVDEPQLPTLHSIIFVHNLQLEHYQKAYHALEANPDNDRRKDCLRQLVGSLLEKKQLDILMQFSYDGIISDFENIVESRARAMNLHDNYIYHFLYAFHVQRNNFRRAAAVMYEQGLLSSEINEEWALERQVKSYLCAVNALALVDANYQFLMRPRAFVDDKPVTKDVKNLLIGRGELLALDFNEIQEKIKCDERFQILLDDDDDGIEEDDNEQEEIIQLKRDVEVLEIKDIEKELAHVTARLKLFKLSPQSQISCYTTPSELVGLLVNVRHFEAAANLCTIFNLPYDTVFEGLTTACLHLNTDCSPESSVWLFENSIGDVALGESDPAKAAWMLLESMLNRYEQPHMTVLYKIVANQILGLGAFLPYWLLAGYKLRNPGELLHLFNNHNRVMEACEIAVEYLDAAMGKGRELFGLKQTVAIATSQFYIPLNIISIVEARLKWAAKQDEEYESCYQQLHNTFTKFINQLNEFDQ